jgi:hypothetical protein
MTTESRLTADHEGPLRDAHGRVIGDLRVSVTDRCNFRCQYCMPADGLPWLERDEILRFEEIERVVGLLVRLGIEDTRCPQGSGVLLYCLTEGYDPSSPRIGSGGVEIFSIGPPCPLAGSSIKSKS